jgi:hypothetical protein
LENILTGLLYSPFLVTPFALLLWYALSGARHTGVVAVRREAGRGGRVMRLTSRGQRGATWAA